MLMGSVCIETVDLTHTARRNSNGFARAWLTFRVRRRYRVWRTHGTWPLCSKRMRRRCWKKLRTPSVGRCCVRGVATAVSIRSPARPVDWRRFSCAENPDIRERLHSGTHSKAEQKRQSSQISRLLRLFCAHGLILKLKGAHRYQLTAVGRRILPAFIAAHQATTEKLNQLAA